jgi:hypothetical protein
VDIKAVHSLAAASCLNRCILSIRIENSAQTHGALGALVDSLKSALLTLRDVTDCQQELALALCTMAALLALRSENLDEATKFANQAITCMSGKLV